MVGNVSEFVGSAPHYLHSIYMVIAIINQKISITIPDWSREACGFFEWAPERKLIASIRGYQRARRGKVAKFKLVYKLYAATIIIRHRFWSAICGADIPLTCQLGGGFQINHGQGVVIHPSSTIGVNCLVMSQVVIGSTTSGTPTIGAHVDFGAGAKILGPVTIGNNVLVGANAVVLTDVPSDSTVVGIPARVIKHGN
jgi:serine O-acetyltransferase